MQSYLRRRFLSQSRLWWKRNHQPETYFIYLFIVYINWIQLKGQKQVLKKAGSMAGVTSRLAHFAFHFSSYPEGGEGIQRKKVVCAKLCMPLIS